MTLHCVINRTLCCGPLLLPQLLAVVRMAPATVSQVGAPQVVPATPPRPADIWLLAAWFLLVAIKRLVARARQPAVQVRRRADRSAPVEPLQPAALRPPAARKPRVAQAPWVA